MQTTVYQLLFLAVICIALLMVIGVQRAKKNGKYLQPDNPLDYVKSEDGLIKELPVEEETVNPEEGA